MTCCSLTLRPLCLTAPVTRFKVSKKETSDYRNGTAPRLLERCCEPHRPDASRYLLCCVSNRTSLESSGQVPKRCVGLLFLRISNINALDVVGGWIVEGDNIVPTSVLFPGQAMAKVALPRPKERDLPARRIPGMLEYPIHIGRHGSTGGVSSAIVGILLPVSWRSLCSGYRDHCTPSNLPGSQVWSQA